MKKIIAAVLAATMVFPLGACAGAEKKADVQTQEKAETQADAQDAQAATPDADWDLPETTGMTDEVTTVFNKAMEGLVGVNYEPVGYLGQKEGVYCVLCRATVVVPSAKPYYALVYVSDAGLQNIWEIWMGAHAEKKAE